MLITAIKQTSPGQLTVTLEDEREIKTTLGVVTELRLFSGRELDEGALEELEHGLRSCLRGLHDIRASGLNVLAANEVAQDLDLTRGHPQEF